MSAIYLTFEGEINSPEDLSKLLEVRKCCCQYFNMFSLKKNQNLIDWNNGREILVDLDVDTILQNGNSDTNHDPRKEMLLSIAERSWENSHSRIIQMKVKIFMYSLY